MSSYVWAPVPVVAVAVQIAFAASDRVDALERIILRLLALKPQRVEELAKDLGFSESPRRVSRPARSDERALRQLGEELVLSALNSLLAQGLIEHGAEDQESFLPTARDARLLPSQLIPGWAFYLPHCDEFASYLLAGNGLRPKPFAGTLIADNIQLPRVEWPTVTRLRSSLLRLSATDPECYINPNREKSAPEADDIEALTVSYSLGPRIAGLYLDSMGRRNSTIKSWARVELMRAIAGPSKVILFEPVVCGLPVKSEISPGLQSWMASSYPEAWEAITDFARHDAEKFSVVLQMLNLTPESLSATVKLHFEELCGDRFSDSGAFLGKTNLREKFNEAMEWLVLWRYDPKYLLQLQDAAAHLVEAFCERLAQFASPLLHRFQAAWVRLEKQDKKRRQVELKAGLPSRLRIWRLEGRLGISARYLKQSTENLEFMVRDPRGAGSYVTKWLTPIFFLDEGEGQKYALAIATAIDNEPLLFEYLQQLIEFRNSVFHNDRGTIPDHLKNPSVLIERLWWVLRAIHDAYCEGAPFGEAAEVASVTAC